jgi:rfaE bifunctional protein kinase chain/domain
MTDRSALLAAIPHLAGRRILVVGDLFLDEYLIGRASRLSREAPIPVLEYEEQRRLPGGGANPSVNIVALEGQVTQVGLVGDDEAGHALLSLLDEKGIGVEGVVVDPGRPTSTKKRVVARGSLRFPQQVARIDRIDRCPLSPEIEAQVVARIQDLAEQADGILVSDYRSGLLTVNVVEAIRAAASRGPLICVDSQGRLGQFAGFDLLKCNGNELRDYCRLETGQDVVLSGDGDFERVMTRLRRELRVRTLLATRGADGLSLCGEFGCVHLPAANRSEVFDVTGAGDTVIAVATLALVAEHNPLTAATLANLAAGLVVRRLGVAAPSPEELVWAVENWRTAS